MIPKISVIVPIYNVEKYIKRCIDSILSQSLRDIEIILIDDGSPDKCGEICDDYAKIDSRIKVIHTINGGVSKARNIGIKNAQGEYITFVDPDDYINENMYEIMYKAVKKNNAEIAISSFSYIIDGKQQPQDISNNKLNFNKNEAITNYFNMIYPFNYSFLCNKIFRRNLFEEIRLNTNILVQEDTEVMIKLYNNSSIITYIGQPLYFYELRDGSATSNKISIGKITTEQAFLEIYKYVKENLPEFKSKSLLKYISYYFNIIVEIIKHYDVYGNEYIKLIKKLKLIYKDIIFDRKIPIKYKIHSSFILVSPKLYKYYININLKCKIMSKK